MAMWELHTIVWREPWWLVLALQPMLMVIIARLWRRENQTAYADRELHPWVIIGRQRKSWRQFLLRACVSRTSFYNLAWILLAIAAAGPRIPLEVLGEAPHYPLDVYVVVDVSQSMQAADILPTRLHRARQEIGELLPFAQNSRMGVIVFAARPHLLVPLTSDQHLFQSYLDLLEQLVLPTRGSQAAAAIALAQQELAQSSQQKGIILITDGDFGPGDSDQHQQLTTAIANLRQANINFSILGIGSVEGEAIQLQDGSWLSHEGRPVISRMNEPLLQQLARDGGGYYHKVENDNSDWQYLYVDGIAKDLTVKDKVFPESKTLWRELYHWALVPAVLLLFGSVMLPAWLPRRSQNLVIMAVFVFAGIFSVNPNASAEDEISQRQAWQYLQQQDYAAALEIYMRLPDYSARLGEGASRYYLQDYSGAIKQFSQAALQANNDKELAVAVYNLGNSYFQAGDYTLAARSYEDALRYRSEHAATRNNLELSQQLILLLDKRQRQYAATNRSGRGPRQAPAMPAMTLDQGASVTLDQTTAQKSDTELPRLAQLSDEQLAALLAKGLEHLQLVQAGTATASRATATGPAFAVPTDSGDIDAKRAQLWRRLFEMEEGFAAPLEQPRAIPGVSPW